MRTRGRGRGRRVVHEVVVHGLVDTVDREHAYQGAGAGEAGSA
jgi:hypothetical protein